MTKSKAKRGLLSTHTLRCKHCKVPVVSKTNVRAILGRVHGKHCPRRNK